MGLRAVALGLALALTAPAASPVDRAASYLLARRQGEGGFAEPGRRPDPSLSAWVALALAAAGRRPAGLASYLAREPTADTTDLALRILALRGLGEEAGALVERLEQARRPDGRIGPLVNSTAWGVLALRAVGRPPGAATVRYLLRRQSSSGGWSYAEGAAADSNDTSAVVQALRAAGVSARSAAIRRAVAYLRRLQNANGGFSLLRGRASDAQSTAWSVQALVSAGRRPGRQAFSYLLRLRRADGSFRYSRRYAITPVWVTAQVVPALLRKPFPYLASGRQRRPEATRSSISAGVARQLNHV